MKPRNSAYSDVDELIASTSLNQVLSHFGHTTAESTSGEFRMPCVFNPDCADSSYGSLTVNLSDAAHRIYCHSCGIRGNLLTLLWGLEHGSPPSGGKLRGDEFKLVVKLLKEIRGTVAEDSRGGLSAKPDSPDPKAVDAESNTRHTLAEPQINVPLVQQEKTRGLENLYEDFIVDPADMSPAAAAYFRQRPWLTPEVCRKWRMGYLARSGRSLLRGNIVYAHHNEAGQIISYSGRDPSFNVKWDKWLANGRPDKKRPSKHRYVKGYLRGIELYGQQRDRLKEPAIRESLQEFGLVIVEGQNDVIRLDCLGVASVALTSNRATEEQIDKLHRFAQHVANNRILLMPDNDGEGDEGFRDLMWELATRGVDVKLVWSSTMNGRQFEGKEPEQITSDEWQSLRLGHSDR